MKPRSDSAALAVHPDRRPMNSSLWAALTSPLSTFFTLPPSPRAVKDGRPDARSGRRPIWLLAFACIVCLVVLRGAFHGMAADFDNMMVIQKGTFQKGTFHDGQPLSSESGPQGYAIGSSLSCGGQSVETPLFYAPCSLPPWATCYPKSSSTTLTTSGTDASVNSTEPDCMWTNNCRAMQARMCANQCLCDCRGKPKHEVTRVTALNLDWHCPLRLALPEAHSH